MRQILAGLGICIILALDWLALDDITTGREPSFVVEWTFLVVSLPAVWGLLRLGRRHGPGEQVASGGR